MGTLAFGPLAIAMVWLPFWICAQALRFESTVWLDDGVVVIERWRRSLRIPLWAIERIEVNELGERPVCIHAGGRETWFRPTSDRVVLELEALACKARERDRRMTAA